MSDDKSSGMSDGTYNVIYLDENDTRIEVGIKARNKRHARKRVVKELGVPENRILLVEE